MPTDRPPWLDAAAWLVEPAARRLRTLIEAPDILRLPGAHSGLAALQARTAGFEALYLSGAAMSASMGMPDVGLLTPDDILFFVRQIVRASGLPVLVDGDTGHGGPLNVMQLVRMLEEAGAGGLHIEDQQMPKKCGHLNDKRLVGVDEMAAKIGAAVRARRDLVVVARTDAVAVEGFDAAVDRARAYLAAGADAIFPEALTDKAMFAAFARALPGAKLLANMTEFGRSPDLAAEELEAIGYAMVIWPVSSLRVANHAQAALYAELARSGSTRTMLGAMQTRGELYDLIGLSAIEALDATIARSLLPQSPSTTMENDHA